MKNKNRLSSNLTFTYKYILPLLPIGIAIFVNLIIDKESNQGYFIPVNIFFLIFFLIPFIQLRDLKKVEYDKKNLLVSNFIKTEIYDLINVLSVKRWFFFFYIISIQAGNKIRKVKILSPANERILRPFDKIDSIIKFERIINKK